MQGRQLVPRVCSKHNWAGRIWHCNRTSRLPGELGASDKARLIFMGLRGILRIVKCIYTWSQQRIQRYINTISLFYKTQNSTVTIQSNRRYNDTQHILLHNAYRRHLHLQYVKYTGRSGPFIVSPRLPPAVSCCWQVSSRYGHLKVCHVLYTWVAAALSAVVKYFYERPFAVLVAKCALKHRYSRGSGGTRQQDLYKMLIGIADWHNACVTQTVHQLHKYKWYIWLW